MQLTFAEYKKTNPAKVNFAEPKRKRLEKPAAAKLIESCRANTYKNQKLQLSSINYFFLIKL